MQKTIPQNRKRGLNGIALGAILVEKQSEETLSVAP
jgi:hypothetical protein